MCVAKQLLPTTDAGEASVTRSCAAPDTCHQWAGERGGGRIHHVIITTFQSQIQQIIYEIFHYFEAIILESDFNAYKLFVNSCRVRCNLLTVNSPHLISLPTWVRGDIVTVPQQQQQQTTVRISALFYEV